MITFKNVTKYYKHQSALSNVSFEINQGDMVFLTGHSGAGKSTLLKLIMGIEPTSRGHVFVENKSLTELSMRQLPFLRRKIGMIFQNPSLLPRQTVFENVAIPLIISGFNATDIKKRVHAALDKVGLRSKINSLPGELSSGEQQRVGIARAVVNKPMILLADEPTGNLDPDLSVEIFKLFEAFHAVGVTVLIATHDISLVSKMHHRSIHLKNGTVLGATCE